MNGFDYLKVELEQNKIVVASYKDDDFSTDRKVLFTMEENSEESLLLAKRMVACYSGCKNIKRPDNIWELLPLLKELSVHKKEQQENRLAINQLNINYDVIRLINWYEFDRFGE